MYSPSPTVRASHIPLYQMGWLGNQHEQARQHRLLGQDGGGDGSGDGGSAPIDFAPTDTSGGTSSFIDPSQLDPGTMTIDPSSFIGPMPTDTGSSTPADAVLAVGDQTLGPSDTVPGTGQTVQDLINIGYSQSEIATMLDSPVPGTGQTAAELLAAGYTPQQIDSLLAQPTPTAPTVLPPTVKSPGGGFSFPGGSGGGASKSGGAPTAKPLPTPATPKPVLRLPPGPSPRVASKPSALPSFITQSSLISGVPNWAMFAGALLLAPMLGDLMAGSGGRRRR